MTLSTCGRGSGLADAEVEVPFAGAILRIHYATVLVANEPRENAGGDFCVFWGDKYSSLVGVVSKPCLKYRVVGSTLAKLVRSKFGEEGSPIFLSSSWKHKPHLKLYSCNHWIEEYTD